MINKKAKNLTKAIKISVILLFLICNSCSDSSSSSSSKEDVLTSNPVALKVVFNSGSVLTESPTVEYIDIDGITKTVVLTTSGWSKNMTLPANVNLYFKISGTIKGGLVMTANVTGDNNKISLTETVNYNVATSFTKTMSEDL